uniref:DUF4440 domain-containing protein n=1 Tax=Acrobeloides nanus TaxID=290746 RepID=A0A914EN22_9BILA
MPTQEEVNQILNKFQSDNVAAYGAGDPAKVAAFYDTHGVIINSTEDKAWHGRTEITKFYTDFMKTETNLKMIGDENFEADNGNYLIQRGHYEADTPRGRIRLPYEQIFKRQKDGSYLIIRDQY